MSTPSPLSSATSLVTLVRHAAARWPDDVAVLSDAPVSFGELDRRSDAVAAGLHATGVRPGDPVGLSVSRGWPAILGAVGILKAGGTYVPLDASYPEERLAFMCRDAGLRHLVADETARPPATIEHVLDLELLATSDGPPPALDEPGASERAAYVIYTSGSTGQPKGVIVSHANVLALLRTGVGLFDVTPSDRWSLFHSFSFDFAVWETWMPLATGGSIVPVSAEDALDAHRFLDLLIERRVTILSQVPSVFTYLSAAYAQRGAPPLHLRYVVFGGEAVNLDAIRRFDAATQGRTPEWINMYGITETTVHTTFKRLGARDLAGSGSPIGRPLPHLRFVLLDEDQQPVERGTAGEIWIAGDGVAIGYLNRPELNAERFPVRDLDGAPTRWYRSGDLARQREDGEFEYVGRGDDQVKVHGFRIELGEIERTVERHDDVRQASVVAVDGAAGTFLSCLAVADGLESADPLRAFLAAQLPQHMVPSRILLVDELPQTQSGKVDRRRVAEIARTLPRHGDRVI